MFHILIKIFFTKINLNFCKVKKTKKVYILKSLRKKEINLIKFGNLSKIFHNLSN
jgi:hypothetical protein